MTTAVPIRVTPGLGWPATDRPVEGPVPHVAESGLGWPEPDGGRDVAAGWADVLIPTLSELPQSGRGSHESALSNAKVNDMAEETTGTRSLRVALASSEGALPDAPHLPGAGVSRETAGTGTGPVADAADASGAAGVSRETPLAADEAAPLADAAEPHWEPHDTPIAQAAATAVRVLGGRYGSPLPRPDRTRVMTVANQKGGVGKTTSTVNLAAALALHGAEVLVVDLDPQGNASTALGVDHHSDVPSVYDVLIEGRPMAEVVAEVEGLKGLSCVPATIDLAGAEIELVSVVARESRLVKALDAYAAHRREHGLARLDYVLVDCPPSLGLLTVNALVAAEEVLIPIQCEYYALEGLGQLIRNVDLVKAHLNPDLHVSTILLTMYDARTRLAAQVAEEVRTHFTETVLRTTIPRSVRISEAPSYGQTVLTYDPASTGALSYLEAAREMALRGARSDDDKETTS